MSTLPKRLFSGTSTSMSTLPKRLFVSFTERKIPAIKHRHIRRKMPRATAGSRVTLPCSTATAWHSPAVAQVCKPAARLTLHAGHRYTGAQGRCCRGGLFDTLSLAVRSNYRPMADASHGPCFSNSWKCCVLYMCTAVVHQLQVQLV